MSEEFQKTDVVYCGYRLLKADKIAECYITIDKLNSSKKDDWYEKDFSLFEVSRKNSSPKIIGAVYNMECKTDEDGRIVTARTASKTWVKKLEDAETIGVWETRSDAAEDKAKETRLLNKMKADRYAEKNAEALKSLYHRVAPSDKMAFEYMLIKFIRNA